MQQEIKINHTLIGTEIVNSVNARELHQQLEIKQKFPNWIQKQIQRANLKEDVHYLTNNIKVDRQILKEYYLTTDSAKHIAMMSQSKQASKIRDYFIEVEKLYKNNITLHQDTNPIIIEMIKTNQQMIQNQETTIKAILNISNDLNRTKSRINDIEEEINELNKKTEIVTLSAPKGGIKKFIEVALENIDLKTEIEELKRLKNEIR